MKINKILPTPSLNKIWSELTKITNKLITLEELVMNNATSSEIFENARQRIVNSALGKALGLTAETSILDTAIEIEGVIDNGAVSKTLSSEEVYNIPKGFHNGNGKVTAPSLKIATVGTFSGDRWTATVTRTADIKTLLPGVYTQLSNENFVYSSVKATHAVQSKSAQDGVGTVTVTHEYNPGTGVLTMTFTCMRGNEHQTYVSSATVECYYVG